MSNDATTTAAIDERRGLPSCSQFAALALCPGRHRATLGMEGETSEAAEKGNRIHAALETGDLSALAPEEKSLAESCKKQTEEVLAQWLDSLGAKAPDMVLREKRLFAANYSGKADYLALSDLSAIVVDYKTGRVEVDSAEINLQMRGLAALVRANFQLETVLVAVVQPLHGEPKLCKYNAHTLMQAAAQADLIAAVALMPDAPRRPGTACQYCPACGTARCPESIRAIVTVADIEQAVAQLDPPQLAEFLGKIEVAERAIRAARERAKGLLEADPEAIPGWVLRPGATRRTVTDTAAAANLLAAHIPPDAIMKSCNLSLGDLEKTVAGVLNLTQRAAAAWVNERLSPWLEAKRTAPSLARKTKEV